MSEAKRRPGRPKGSEKDDSVPLMAMARLIMDHPGLPPKTAARRVFRGGTWGRLTEDSALHRWQGKWKTSGADYLQRVHAERAAAEAERQRQERAAQQRRQASSRTAWELMADARAAGHLPGWELQGTMQKIAAQHAMMTPRAADLLAIANAMPKMGLSRADLVANPALAGITMSDAVRRSLEIVNATGIGDAMRKYDTLGRALQGFSAVHLPKLPKGL